MARFAGPAIFASCGKYMGPLTTVLCWMSSRWDHEGVIAFVEREMNAEGVVVVLYVGEHVVRL